MRNLIRCTVVAAVALSGISSALGQLPALDLTQPQSAVREHGVLLLRNGQVLVGDITKIADHYSIVVDRGEVRLHQRDVQCVCRDLMDAYRQKRLQARDDCVQDHLELAQWCQSNGLLANAGEELKIAAALNPNHPLIPLVDRKIRMSAQQQEMHTEQPSSVQQSRGPSVEELDRMVMGMPSGAVEMFTQTIQPMLINNCTVSGCHTTTAADNLRLLRIPSGRPPSRRLTQRNLHAVIGLIRWDDPANSPLLTAPIKPHGTSRTALFTDRQVDQYQDLVKWVHLVALGKKIEREKPKDVAKAAPNDVRLPGGAVRPASHEMPVGQDGALPSGEEVLPATGNWLNGTMPTEGDPAPSLLRFRPALEPTPGIPGGAATAEPPAQEPPSRSPAGQPHRSGGASRVQRGATIPQFTPIDAFDADVFNRRFAPQPAAPPNAAPPDTGAPDVAPSNGDQ